MRATILLLITLTLKLPALEPELLTKGELVFSTDFEKALPKRFTVQFGDWKVANGVLRARQIPADNHGAAARQGLEMQDGMFQLRFRLTDKGKGFHFGFDPKRGTLKKKGHLFSVIASPTLVKIMKHVDKANREKDPNEDLAKANHRFTPGKWHGLLLEKKGTDVIAQIQPSDGGKAIRLKASHPTFRVSTPTLVFRCIGDGVEIDDIKVWNAK